MNRPKEIIINTPKNKQRLRRLGLSRISSATPLNKETKIPQHQKNTDTHETPESTTPLITQSDLRINYKCLDEQQASGSKYRTPALTKYSTPLVATTSYRPYRLALSKKVREKLKKKRLHFNVESESNEVNIEKDCQTKTPTEVTSAVLRCKDQNQHENTVEIVSGLENPTLRSQKDNLKNHKAMETVHIAQPNEEDESSLRTKLIEDIMRTKDEVKAQEKHILKVKELTEAIAIWRGGFDSALNDLQQQIEPHLEKSVLLERLCIPQRMLKYIED